LQQESLRQSGEDMPQVSQSESPTQEEEAQQQLMDQQPAQVALSRYTQGLF